MGLLKTCTLFCFGEKYMLHPTTPFQALNYECSLMIVTLLLTTIVKHDLNAILVAMMYLVRKDITKFHPGYGVD